MHAFWGRDVIRDLYHLHGKLAPPEVIDRVVLRTWRLVFAWTSLLAALRMAVKVGRSPVRGGQQCRKQARRRADPTTTMTGVLEWVYRFRSSSGQQSDRRDSGTP